MARTVVISRLAFLHRTGGFAVVSYHSTEKIARTQWENIHKRETEMVKLLSITPQQVVLSKRGLINFLQRQYLPSSNVPT